MCLCIAGNVISLVNKLCVQKSENRKLGYHVFVTSLCISDLLMGVYLAFIGAADLQYRGKYLWSEVAWRSSPVCHVAGFVSLVSSEVSALMICLITLDRFIVLRFPFSVVRFKGWSAYTAVALSWMLCLVLAATPLLPSLHHWRFYAQSGVCAPLPSSSSWHSYNFAVLIVFNLTLFVLIAVGQGSVYWSIRHNAMTLPISDKTSSQNMTIARRLVTVVVSDFLCWFPVGVLG